MVEKYARNIMKHCRKYSIAIDNGASFRKETLAISQWKSTYCNMCLIVDFKSVILMLSPALIKSIHIHI